MNSASKIALSFSALTLIATGWLYNLHWQDIKAIEVMESAKTLMKKRVEADELLLNGKTEKAFALYREIDSITHDSIAQQRKRLPFLTFFNADPESLASHIRNQNNLNSFEDKKKDNDGQPLHLEKQLKKQVISLTEKLNSAQKKIESLKVNNKGVTRFMSSKNISVTYLGDLLDGKATGSGYGFWATGSTYDGTWKGNMRHGKGIFLWADGVKYEGDYVNDQRHGHGIYTAKAGRYEGEWNNDMRDGEGNLYEANGKLKVHGIWKKDKLVKTIK